MFTLITTFILFTLTLFGFLFAPGAILLWSSFKNAQFTTLEFFILSVPLSFSLSTIMLILIGHTTVTATPLTTEPIMIGYCILLIFCTGGTFLLRKTNTSVVKKTDTSITSHISLNSRFVTILILATIMLFVIKVTFLTNTIFPTATDLGHHMFWVSKSMTEGTLPIYEKITVTPIDTRIATESAVAFSDPVQIADFIIGEHLIFIAVMVLSGASIVSAFPSLLLFFIHIFTLFTLFIFALRLFQPLPYGRLAALFSFILIGPLYAIGGAQAKFVSGGVIGNIFGNLLIITFLYFLYRGLKERTTHFIAIAGMLGVTLVLSHHLSTFVLLYAFFGILISFAFHNARTLVKEMIVWRKILFHPLMLVLYVCAGILLFMIHVPSYLNETAITSSVGTPIKSTRMGIPLTQFIQMSGEARFTMGFIGILLLFTVLSPHRYNTRIKSLFVYGHNILLDRYAHAFLSGWLVMLTLMAMMPQLLKVNILSSRIATYAVFPLALVGGLALGWLVNILFTSKNRPFTPLFAYSTFTIIILFVFTNGLADSGASLTATPKTEPAIQTFHAARYLAQHTPQGVWALKDHNHIVADTWMKVFLHTDYSNPLSRSFFKRYETHPTRERCTREMISDPHSAFAMNCYNTLTIGPVVVNTKEDAGQFLTHPDFIKVYENNYTSTFWYNPHL